MVMDLKSINPHPYGFEPCQNLSCEEAIRRLVVLLKCPLMPESTDGASDVSLTSTAGKLPHDNYSAGVD
jgi:hypothetical protein